MALVLTVKKLCDNFNTDNFLEVASINGHDMEVRTISMNPLELGPGSRVYHYMGSGSDHHVALFEYFTAMSKHYGSENVPPVDQEQFAFEKAPTRLKKPKEIKILDTPENQIHLRAIRTHRYLGFQTYNDIESGPVVWFDKNLPAVKRETKDLEKVILEYNQRMLQAV